MYLFFISNTSSVSRMSTFKGIFSSSSRLLLAWWRDGVIYNMPGEIYNGRERGLGRQWRDGRDRGGSIIPRGPKKTKGTLAFFSPRILIPITLIFWHNICMGTHSRSPEFQLSG
eukprot:sb/3476892/